MAFSFNPVLVASAAVATIVKNTPNTRLEKFLKLAMSGNGSNVNLKRHFLLKLVKSLWVNLFPASFSHLESLCAGL